MFYSENDILKNASVNNEAEILRFKNKLKSTEDALKELKNSFSHLKADVCYEIFAFVISFFSENLNENQEDALNFDPRKKFQREKLHNAYRDKAKQADHLSQLSQQFDHKLQKLRNELAETIDKVIKRRF